MTLTPEMQAVTPGPGATNPPPSEPINVKTPGDDSKANATDPVAETMTAVIRQVRGQVQVRSGADAEWVKAEVGMRLTPGAEFRTGLRSQVAFAIPPGEVIALDRLGRVQLIDAVRIGNKIKTDIGMPYGRAAYTVEAAGVEHESTMHMPGNTLAIRGTQAVMFSQRPFPAQVTMMYGTASFATTHQGTIDVTGHRPGPARPATDTAEDLGQATGPSAESGPTTAMMTQDHNIAVATGEESGQTYAIGNGSGEFEGGSDFLADLSDPIVSGAGFPGFDGLGGTTTANNNNPDPGSAMLANQFTNLNNNFGNTDTEDGLKITFPSGNPGRGGGFKLDNNTSPAGPPIVEGILDIMLTWHGNLDLDLLWRTPNGFEISPSPNASPIAAMSSPDGARVDGEDHPGPNGTERIIFDGFNGEQKASYPVGDHYGTVLVFNGEGTASFHLQVKRQFGEGHQEILGDFQGTLDPEEVTEFGKVIHVPENQINPNKGTTEQHLKYLFSDVQ